VTIVILLVLVVVLWIVVLTPSAVRRLSERQGVGSIDHFHHQLQLLEHAGPKLVAPAYRLHTALPGGAGGGDFTPMEFASERPKLVLLRPVDDERSADIDGDDGAHYERVGVLDTPEPMTSPAETRAELAAYRRQEARHRCTVILRLLVTATISTGLIGMLPTARLAWIGTGIFGAAVLGLLALIGYAREVEMQQRHRRPSFLEERYDDEYDDTYVGAAEAGYPGAWDDEHEALPHQFAAAR
jgi:hypothetical protein